MMMFFFLLIIFLFTPSKSDLSHCDRTQLCRLIDDSTAVVCDSTYGKPNESDVAPFITCFPPVKSYLFRNFKRLRSHTFQGIKFPENQSFSVQLVNIAFIEPEAFSDSLIIPLNSKLSVEVGHIDNPFSITLRSNAFNHLKIENLSFINIQTFNGRSTFDPDCFGNDLDINLLTFQDCPITGFSSIIRKAADVLNLSIKNSAALTQITERSLPSFLSTTRSLEISNTSLQAINQHAFQAWALKLEELSITNNQYLETFPPNIIDGVLMLLNKLDLSYNAIKNIDTNYDWFPYSSVKNLLLRNQQLDLFLKSNILTKLNKLETIDLSDGFITENNEDLIKNYFPNITNLISIDVSRANFTENMIIDLLTSISQTAYRFIDIGLHGHQLSDEKFCSYFQIFKNAPGLLQLHLDDTHDCNCVIDLFFTNNGMKRISDSMNLPTCLTNVTRIPCNIDEEVSILKCKVSSGTSNNPNRDNNLGKYAFGFIAGGVVVLLMVLLLLGFGVYRIKSRKNSILDMEQPVENPLAAIIEERLQNQ